MKWCLAAPVLAGLFMLAAPHAGAAGPTAISLETMHLSLSGPSLVVDDVVAFTGPAPQGLKLPLFPGASGIQAKGAGGVLASSVAVRPGVRSVVLHYRVPAQDKGLSVPWRLDVPIRRFVVVTGPGVTLPIELNQAFYPQSGGRHEANAADRSVATDLPAGVIQLNVQMALPPPPVFTFGFFDVALALAAGVVLVWWARRPRRT